MTNDPIAGLDRDTLEELARSLLWQYRIVDAFWFINVENRFDLTTAEDLNAAVWAKAGKLAAKDIKERFNITAGGLQGFVQAMHYYPWYLMDSFRIQDKGNELIVSSDNCPAQLGRLKHGLGEYACKEMHGNEFVHFCKVIDPRIRVDCEFAPPDPHPEGLFCKWRISCG
ncbi:MAG: DUF6125 family protein [Desulfohalobiaceae bacterium]|nr:DUF6125 family protein [Desulfohalobiaceae bacterium]